MREKSGQGGADPGSTLQHCRNVGAVDRCRIRVRNGGMMHVSLVAIHRLPTAPRETGVGVGNGPMPRARETLKYTRKYTLNQGVACFTAGAGKAGLTRRRGRVSVPMKR